MRLISAAVAILFATVVYAAGDVKTGKAAYDQHCKNCHGETGVANAKIAKMMHVEVRDLGSPDVQKLSDSELRKIITDGKGKMPPVRSVTGNSVEDVVAYIRTFKK